MDTRKSVTVQVLFIDTVDNVKKLLGFLSGNRTHWNEWPQQKVALDNAIEHIEWIVRIIRNPGGNGMLIGVGASGKQSLPKMIICGTLSFDQYRGMGRTLCFPQSTWRAQDLSFIRIVAMNSSPTSHPFPSKCVLFCKLAQLH
jgi:hypothetical protein